MSTLLLCRTRAVFTDHVHAGLVVFTDHVHAGLVLFSPIMFMPDSLFSLIMFMPDSVFTDHVHAGLVVFTHHVHAGLVLFSLSMFMPDSWFGFPVIAAADTRVGRNESSAFVVFADCCWCEILEHWAPRWRCRLLTRPVSRPRHVVLIAS